MESSLGAGTVILAHIGFVYLMSECCPFISIKFTRIYHLRGCFSKISPRGTYPWSPLDNTVVLTLFLIKSKKTCCFTILYTFVCVSSYLLLRQSNETVGKLTGTLCHLLKWHCSYAQSLETVGLQELSKMSLNLT